MWLDDRPPLLHAGEQINRRKKSKQHPCTLSLFELVVGSVNVYRIQVC